MMLSISDYTQPGYIINALMYTTNSMKDNYLISINQF